MSGLQRIIWHWSAGTYTPGASEAEHYHYYIDGGNVVRLGDYTPEDNLDTSDERYAAHVASMNTGSIGVAICAMNGAVEKPFVTGPYPIRQGQLDTMISLTADLCNKYNIAVGRTTTLSHAEVEPTLGVVQNGKWDITWLPGMVATGDPVAVGDKIRSAVALILAPPPSRGESLLDQFANLTYRVEALEAWRATFPS